MNSFTPQCTARVYVHLQTLTRPWDGAELVSRVCAALTTPLPAAALPTWETVVTSLLQQKVGLGNQSRHAALLALDQQTILNGIAHLYPPAYFKAVADSAVAPASPPTVRNAIVFAHSLGNLVLTAALQQGACRLDTATTSWYQISAPALGSPVADLLPKLCAEPGLFGSALAALLEKFGYCAPDRSVNPTYISLSTSYAGFARYAPRAFLSSHGNGSLCGNSALGLPSFTGLGLEAMSLAAHFDGPNDGMVSAASCGVTGAFTNNFQDPFYTGPMNHADSACEEGDGHLTAQRPCSWYAYRR